MVTATEQQIMDQLTQRLAGAYPHIERDQIARTVSEEFGRFDGRPIRDFIPLLVEKHASNRLAQLVSS
ncbi:three-helix bundle dimerization domain-containing protein [Mycolicibacterium sp.]|uniref:three-helix bundle dimerization domain-containing protein n=1 Tax=Mycolicibacterium sp. TaxID=2320850 RepID=UPI0037CC8C72